MGKTIITKVAAVVGVAAAMAVSANAGTLPLNVGYTGTDVLGELLYGNIGGAGGQAADESADVNNILALSMGTTTGTPGLNYVERSANNFGTLSSALTTGASLNPSSMNTSGNEVLITIGSQGFTYLTARWDGPNAGAEVWDISGVVNTTIEIPLNVTPDSAGTNLVANGSGQYGITSYTLFNPSSNTPPPSVPEVVSSIALLGGVVAGLGLMRKKFGSK